MFLPIHITSFLNSLFFLLHICFAFLLAILYNFIESLVFLCSILIRKLFPISVISLHCWSNHWILSLSRALPVVSSDVVHVRCLILDYCLSTLDFSVNWLLIYNLIELQYSFTSVRTWSLLISHLKYLAHRYFNSMEILIQCLILIIKWSESQSAHRRLLTSVISEAYLLLIMICSIWLNVCQPEDFQIWRWILLCENMTLTVKNSMQVAKSHSFSTL